ncbi:MAG: aminoglycoside phosphotransferase family protein [Chthoniobacterales bacterium]
MRTDALLRRTRLHFPRLERAPVKITPIEKGGSDRKFYRVRCGGEQSLILVKYNLEREENRHYVQIADFLAAHQIRAPKIYFHDAEEGLIWVEDLGERDLWSHRDEPWLLRRAFYRSALEEIAKLHALPQSVASEIEAHLPAQFDAGLYRWEQNYFLENCLGRIFGLGGEELEQLAAIEGLEEMANRLAQLPRVLVHRDFQSQNIIMRESLAHLIDFQGMRPGLAEYDIASLLYDPYVVLPQNEREELLGDYEQIRERVGNPVSGEFRDVICLCAVQRLMQALGAYGFLGLVKGNTAFLDHVPAAMESLRGLVAGLPRLARLNATLKTLQ